MFGVASIVVFSPAVSMMILIGGMAMRAATALDMHIINAQITSTRILNARFMHAGARVADARVIKVVTTCLDAGVTSLEDAGLAAVEDAGLGT